MARAVVTGLGCVSALGMTVGQAWASALDGRGGARSEIVAAGDPLEVAVRAVIAPLPEDPLPALMQRFGRKLIHAVDRFANLAAAATLEAVADAGLKIGSPALDEAAIVYGACSGGLVSIEAAYHRMYAVGAAEPHPLTVPRLMVSSPTSHLSILFGVRGLGLTIASACASSAHAIVEGMHLIRSGRARMVIVGGADASLTYGGLRSWQALQALSDQACRPFSAGRDGTILGEGAATLILENEDDARARGAPIRAVISGAGANSDARHMTQPDPDSAAAVVAEAHRDAGLSARTPLLISAHGTGTVLNDRSETKALRQVYGDSLDDCAVIATKSLHGHMLGASGAMELLLAILALEAGEAPAIANHLGPDPECDLPLVIERRPISYRAAMSTSFAFGGSNAALLVELP